MDGRKISKTYENPLDTFIIDIGQKLSPIFYRYNMRPNHITTIGNIFGIMSIYNFYKKNYKISSIFYFTRYFFDCLDGNYARYYKMASNFGDLYDHISDIIFNFIIFTLLFNKKFKYKIYWVLLLLCIFIVMSIHLGCQEKIYKKKSVLTLFKKFCKDENNIIYTKYFGCGTLILLTSLLIYNIKYFIIN